jgi:uncharacterized protein
VTGEVDLARILESMRVVRREGVFVFATIPPGRPLPDVPLAAMVAEVEGTTVVLDRDAAVGAGVQHEFEAAWLTVEVVTSLQAIGVTASVATALAMRGIPVNVVAGFHHDHLLVPLDQVDEAVAAVDLLRQQR